MSGDPRFHDKHGNHVRPTALRGGDALGNGVPAAVPQHRIDAYADHIIAHQQRGEPTEEDE